LNTPVFQSSRTATCDAISKTIYVYLPGFPQSLIRSHLLTVKLTFCHSRRPVGRWRDFFSFSPPSPPPPAIGPHVLSVAPLFFSTLWPSFFVLPPAWTTPHWPDRVSISNLEPFFLPFLPKVAITRSEAQGVVQDSTPLPPFLNALPPPKSSNAGKAATIRGSLLISGSFLFLLLPNTGPRGRIAIGFSSHILFHSLLVQRRSNPLIQAFLLCTFFVRFVVLMLPLF